MQKKFTKDRTLKEGKECGNGAGNGKKRRGQVIYLPKMFRIDEKLEFKSDNSTTMTNNTARTSRNQKGISNNEQGISNVEESLRGQANFSFKTFIEGHGGAIEVQSDPGKGSTFTVKLPVFKKEK